MRFEGCHKPLGCTIILRGGDVPTLRKVKEIVKFMALVVYQLKNEHVMYTEEHNLLPPEPLIPVDYINLLDALEEPRVPDDPSLAVGKDAEATLLSDAPVQPAADESNQEADLASAEAMTRDIARSIKPYLTTLLSASAAIRFPPPAPLARMADIDRKLNQLRQARDLDEEAEILKDEQKVAENGDIVQKENMAIPVITTTAETPLEKPNPIDALPVAASPVSLSIAARKDIARDPYRILRPPDEVARHAAIAHLEYDHSQQIETWQSYIRRHPVDLRPEDYQGLLYTYTLTVNDKDDRDRPCVEPQLHHVSYYQADDLTVGQFIEGFVNNGHSRCANKSCDRQLNEHVQLLVHGNRRLQIAGEEYIHPTPAREDQIVTWSYCPFCSTPEQTYATPPTIMRDETWKMSWGAYLEHCFYPPLVASGFDCPHDAFRGKIHYFSYQNFAVRIHNDDIDVFEPIRPAIALQIRQETKVNVKNAEYENALAKNTTFFDSVLNRLRGLSSDVIQPEKVRCEQNTEAHLQGSSLKEVVGKLLARATADREEIVNVLNRTYKLTPLTDVLAMNPVLRAMQDKVVQWE